ncbi:putative membrane protein [Anaplasma phagocytophilum str. ApWI1]|uniref:Uncharacterized protein n=3 Tax=Anaplasma phagocytophilum TaxID=948 RepID=Q2GJN4_ANAPZ|nr:hypothetical protein APH_0840 [Anaplasma phagocytophilum str. HZ]AGR79512.1 hypothetical protein YYU_03895 [Anaplasma phagocytophilum str. HZ2]AGR80761.1 hypothetical protein WSQ_03895 [Anaplasma phagocytophilum str. JM]AGR82013.1 hypothetical protein YYY_03885 [Anaplasma phagocytophilum str. Dog2]KJV59716.1 putative membrane protein [Anaplasma phagocytophilum str. Webster]KJV63180.1 putative membrane protein [Anaplasma phagocytophilum str. NCH-1]KJV83097.1 putative membrane protein [Anapl
MRAFAGAYGSFYKQLVMLALILIDYSFHFASVVHVVVRSV